jgi:hypothetical protein
MGKEGPKTITGGVWMPPTPELAGGTAVTKPNMTVGASARQCEFRVLKSLCHSMPTDLGWLFHARPRRPKWR